MEKEFVPYELAVKLKSLEFNEPCFGHYANAELVYDSHTNNEMQRFRYAAPTFSQVFRWFRDEHDIVSYINRFEDNTFDYECNSPKFKEVIDFEDGPFDTYEEAELACLEKLIEIVELKSE
jgi:hypothetical protein